MSFSYRFIFVLITILSAFLVSCGLKFEREREPNGSFFTAQPVTSGKPVRAAIDTAGDVDFYRISPGQKLSGDVSADISVSETANLDLVLKLYRENKVIKLVNDSSVESGTEGGGERIVNALFPYDDIMSGNAVFSVEEAPGTVSDGKGGRKEYELRLLIRASELTEEGEPDDRAVDAVDVSDRNTIRGYFNPSADRLGETGEVKPEEDWYTFTIDGPEGGIVNVSHTAVPEVDSTLSLFDEFGYLVREADSNGAGEPEKMRNVGLIRGRYYLRLRSAVPFQQNLKVSYLLKIDREPDAGIESEPNDKYPYADQIQFSSEIRGCFNPTADTDWFRFNVYNPGRQVITVKVSPTADIDPVVEIYSSSMERLIHADDRGYDQGEIIRNLGVEEGVYYLKLFNRDENVDNPDADYALLVEREPWNEEQEFEKNDDMDSADRFEINSLKKGFITPKGDRDFYAFRVPDAMVCRFEVTPCVLLDLALQIYDEEGQPVERLDDNPAEEGERGNILLKPGLYYAEVLSNNIQENSRDAYTLRIYTPQSR